MIIYLEDKESIPKEKKETKNNGLRTKAL